MVRFRTRVSESVKVGPFRFRLSEPVGRGRPRGSVGVRVGRRGWLSFGTAIGGGGRSRRRK
jgi:hypothetical protein